MQMDKAFRQRTLHKPCRQHKEIDKEYYLGAQTGDYVCRKCGTTFAPEEYKTLLKAQRKKK